MAPSLAALRWNQPCQRLPLGPPEELTCVVKPPRLWCLVVGTPANKRIPRASPAPGLPHRGTPQASRGTGQPCPPSGFLLTRPYEHVCGSEGLILEPHILFFTVSRLPWNVTLASLPSSESHGQIAPSPVVSRTFYLINPCVASSPAKAPGTPASISAPLEGDDAHSHVYPS